MSAVMTTIFSATLSTSMSATTYTSMSAAMSSSMSTTTMSSLWGLREDDRNYTYLPTYGRTRVIIIDKWDQDIETEIVSKKCSEKGNMEGSWDRKGGWGKGQRWSTPPPHYSSQWCLLSWNPMHSNEGRSDIFIEQNWTTRWGNGGKEQKYMEEPMWGKK